MCVCCGAALGGSTDRPAVIDDTDKIIVSREQ